MRHPGKYLSAFLACWIVLFVPLATSFHYHPAVVPGSGDGTVSQASGGGRSAPDYPPCDICLRLIVQAESFPMVGFVAHSINIAIHPVDNNLPHPPHLFSQIGERAPPLTIG
jgi:hypothetical protein